MRGAWIGDLTWPEVDARLRDGAVVVVPVGAAAKAHGAHLPLDTDRTIACALARRVAEALPVLVAPVIDIGWYPAFVRYPGSQSVTAETFVAVVVQVLTRLVEDGARHLAMLNVGVSTEAPLGIAIHEVRARIGVSVTVADLRHLGLDAGVVLDQKGHGGHADERETSMMLALDPGRVHLDRARPEPESEGRIQGFRRPAVLGADGEGADRSVLGATGDPTLATAEKGERILAAVTRDLLGGLEASFPHMSGPG